MAPRRYPIALFLPRIVLALIAFGRHVIQCMTGNTWFPSPSSPTLAQFSSDLDALDTAEITAKSHAPGAAAARDLKKKAVLDDFEGIKAYVHAIMMQNIASAMAIVLSAGMSPKQFGLRTKLPIEAVVSDVQGQAMLRAKASSSRRAAYEWQMSSDSGKTWVGLGITTDADTVANGLVAGSVYMFQVRATVKKTTGAWTPAVTFMMH